MFSHHNDQFHFLPNPPVQPQGLTPTTSFVYDPGPSHEVPPLVALLEELHLPFPVAYDILTHQGHHDHHDGFFFF